MISERSAAVTAALLRNPVLAVGVPGLTYMSYASNGKPTGARNFVVFDDSQIYITQPGEGLAVYSQERVGVADRISQRRR